MIIELLGLAFLICADGNHSLIQLLALFVKATVDFFKLLIHFLEALVYFLPKLMYLLPKFSGNFILQLSPVRPKQRLHQLFDICQVVEGEKGISHFITEHITPFYERRWGGFLRDLKTNRII